MSADASIIGWWLSGSMARPTALKHAYDPLQGSESLAIAEKFAKMLALTQYTVVVVSLMRGKYTQTYTTQCIHILSWVIHAGSPIIQ